MTDTTIAAKTDTVSDTLKSVADYQAFYATVNGYEEPARKSSAEIIGVRDSIRELVAVPLSQLEYADDGLSGLAEGRTFRVGISPGIISCRSTEYSHKETTLNAAPERRSAMVDMGVRIDPETGELEEDDEAGPSRSEITQWSAKSRANMTKTLASLDYSTWGRVDGSLAMVTFTYPGDWKPLVPDGKAFKRHIEIFRRRFVRAVGPWTLLWKMEFQRRGAPHLHALLRVPAMVGALTFEDWLARTWAAVVGASKDVDTIGRWLPIRDESGDVVDWFIDEDYKDGRHDSEYERHLRSGTAVDFSGKDFSDPRRISMYFAGHSAKSQDGKEYQHVVPPLWQRPGAGPGRFWGFSGLVKAFEELEVTQRDYDRLRRELRKLSRARAWEIAVKRSRGRIPLPLIRAPKLRRSQLGGGGGQNGGWVLLNDAVPVVRGLAGWLATANNGSWDGLIEPSSLDTQKSFRDSEGLARFVWDQAWSRLTTDSVA